VAHNRRRYGGYVVHAAIVLLAIGVAGSSAFQTVRETRLERGQTLRVQDYALTLEGVERREGANAQEVRAILAVERDGKPLDRLEAGRNVYPVEGMTSSEVAIRSDMLTGEDLFVQADEIGADGSVYLKAYVKPLINLIWLAGAVFILGSLITLWPDAREQRRLAARYALPERLARA
jgi:cytochrome c-type biogenesis protein CcmF